MPPARGALPELLGEPGAAGFRVPQRHLRAAALAADLDLHIGHARDSIIANAERNTGMIIPGVVLAAGRSTRMGRPKALLPAGPAGETFVGRIVRTLRAGGVDDVVVVAAGVAEEIGRVLAREEPPPRVVINPDPGRGQFSSLQVGLRTVSRPGVGGVLVTLVDVPLVSAGTVERLLAVHRRTGAPIVRPERQGRHGHPVIFDRSLFREIGAAPADSSAKAIIAAHRRESVSVPVAEDGPFRDIDTPAEYARAFDRRPR